MTDSLIRRVIESDFEIDRYTAKPSFADIELLVKWTSGQPWRVSGAPWVSLGSVGGFLGGHGGSPGGSRRVQGASWGVLGWPRERDQEFRSPPRPPLGRAQKPKGGQGAFGRPKVAPEGLGAILKMLRNHWFLYCFEP